VPGHKTLEDALEIRRRVLRDHRKLSRHDIEWTQADLPYIVQTSIIYSAVLAETAPN
jgi:hypothetical protein